jgi:sugar-specific transcriptional regulator TrmB
MVNYGKTKIYKIWSPIGDKIYIGSTTKNYLSQRMDEHRSSFRKYLQSDKTKMNTSSIIIFNEYGIENCFIELIEAKVCTTKDEQRKLEGKYIREINCLNKNKAGLTKNESQNNYYNNNKDKIKLWQKEKCNCNCGSIFTQSNKSIHERSKKHLNYLQSQ